MEKAIALLEVQAMSAAIEGLDAMLKAADVRLIHVEKRLGGRLVTVVVDGTVSAVTAAAALARDRRKAPHVADADGAARADEKKAQSGSEALPFGRRIFIQTHNKPLFCFYTQERTIGALPQTPAGK